MQLLIHVFIVDQLLWEIVLSKINSALIGNDCIYCYFICNDLFHCIVSHSRLTLKASMYHRGNTVLLADGKDSRICVSFDIILLLSGVVLPRGSFILESMILIKFITSFILVST